MVDKISDLSGLSVLFKLIWKPPHDTVVLLLTVSYAYALSLELQFKLLKVKDEFLFFYFTHRPLSKSYKSIGL